MVYALTATAYIRLSNSGGAEVRPFSMIIRPFLFISSSKVRNETILQDVAATSILPVEHLVKPRDELY